MTALAEAATSAPRGAGRLLLPRPRARPALCRQGRRPPPPDRRSRARRRRTPDVPAPVCSSTRCTRCTGKCAAPRSAAATRAKPILIVMLGPALQRVAFGPGSRSLRRGHARSARRLAATSARPPRAGAPTARSPTWPRRVLARGEADEGRVHGVPPAPVVGRLARAVPVSHRGILPARSLRSGPRSGVASIAARLSLRPPRALVAGVADSHRPRRHPGLHPFRARERLRRGTRVLRARPGTRPALPAPPRAPPGPVPAGRMADLLAQEVRDAIGDFQPGASCPDAALLGRRGARRRQLRDRLRG